LVMCASDGSSAVISMMGILFARSIGYPDQNQTWKTMKGLSIGLILAILLAAIPAQAQRPPCVITYGRFEADGRDRVLRRERCDRAGLGYEAMDRSFFRFYRGSEFVEFEFKMASGTTNIPSGMVPSFPGGGMAWKVIDFMGNGEGPIEGTCIMSSATPSQKIPEFFCEAAYRDFDGLIYWVTAQGDRRR
jgi:hypothetical protein